MDGPPGPHFDIWVCQGRMCTGNGSDALAERARTQCLGERGRVLRGGCYGLCEIGPNVVIRRHVVPKGGALPDVEADRLSLTDLENEVVYSGVTATDVDLIFRSHVEAGVPLPALTREARERALPPQGPVAEKLRALREKRRNRS